eukprot:s180_g17.t1
MLPKRLANHSGQQILKEASEVWESLTRANQNEPPLCQSCDNHPSHLIFNPLFLGLLKGDVCKGTFFEKCTRLPPFKIPFYPFFSLAFLNKYVIFHHNDAGHIQKSFAKALRTRSRAMRSGTLRINLSLLTMRNVPLSSFAGRDLQSDREAAHLFCPKYCSMQAWDRHGLCLMMYTASLTTGQWLASKAFDPLTTLENSLCGYFLTMLDDSLEHHFGRVKSSCCASGTPTIKAACLSTQRLHLKQMRHPTVPDSKKLRFWHGVEDSAEGDAIASRAFRAAVTLRAVAAVQTTPEKVTKEFADWYENVGSSLLFRFDARGASEDMDEDGSEGSDVEMEELPQGQDQPVVQALASLSEEAELKQDIEHLQKCKPCAPTVEPPDTEITVPVLEDVQQPKTTPSGRPLAEVAAEYQQGTQTLAEMLTAHGVEKFQPPDADSTDEASKSFQSCASIVGYQYQVLAVRPHACADLELAITERVWRGSKPKKGKKSISGKPFDSALKAEYTTFVQLVLLQHRGAGLYKATSHSETMFLDPHAVEADATAILYEPRLFIEEIPSSELIFHEDENYLLVEVIAEARKAMVKMAGVAVPATNQLPHVLTLYSFPPTKGGRDATCSYMEVLKRMCEKLEGTLGIQKWEELKCRVPAYFAYKFSHEKFSQKLTHDQQSMAVCNKFKDVAPNKKDGSKAFRRFLEMVDKEAPKALPIEIDD